MHICIKGCLFFLHLYKGRPLTGAAGILGHPDLLKVVDRGGRFKVHLGERRSVLEFP